MGKIVISKAMIPHISVTLQEPEEFGDRSVFLVISRDLANGLWFVQIENWAGIDTVGYAVAGETLEEGVKKFEIMVSAYTVTFARLIGCDPIVHRFVIPDDAGPSLAHQIIMEQGYFLSKNKSDELAKAECIAQHDLLKKSAAAGWQ